VNAGGRALLLFGGALRLVYAVTLPVGFDLLADDIFEVKFVLIE
jgi:hypothetical protein